MGVVIDTGLGLIPAHAGKTLIGASGSPIMRAHPRSRGENWDGIVTVFKTAGSSPLTRGKRATFPHISHRCGLIPAHAGKTTRRSALQSVAGAHPRSRGENTS